MKMRMLDKIPLLYHKTDQEKLLLVEEIEVETFEAESYVVRQGEQAEKFYMITEGIVECSICDETGKEVLLRELKENDYFGEVALYHDTNRSATIRARTKVGLISISRSAFIRNFGNLESLLERKRLESCLRSFELFDKMKLSMPYKQLLVESSTPVFFSNNEIFLKNNLDSFYIIEEGSVEISTFDNNKVILTAGMYFGEKDILEIPTVLTARAIGDVRCLRLKKQQFKAILQPCLYTLKDMIIKGRIGFGGNASVFRVLPRGSNVSFALKRIFKSTLSKRDIERIKIEKSIIFELHHSFIIKCINTFQDSSCLYILQDFAEAGDLRTLLTSHPNRVFTHKVAMFYISIMVIILEYIHMKKIIHRDIKPENILLCRNGYIKLCDFGSASMKDKCYTLAGTSDYMAPEIWLQKGYGISCDYWSMGILIYEMYAGRTPFEIFDETGDKKEENFVILNLKHRI